MKCNLFLEKKKAFLLKDASLDYWITKTTRDTHLLHFFFTPKSIIPLSVGLFRVKHHEPTASVVEDMMHIEQLGENFKLIRGVYVTLPIPRWTQYGIKDSGSARR